MIDAILTNTMLPELSIALLGKQMAGEEVTTIDRGRGGPRSSPTSSRRPPRP